MKKILCLLLVALMLFALCSCDLGKTDDQKDEDPKKDEKPVEDKINTFDEAKAALEAAGYHVITEVEEEMMGEMFSETQTCKTIIATHKEGVADDEFEDFAGKSIMKTKNFVWAFYFDTEAEATAALADIQDLTESFNEMMKGTFEESAEEAAAAGMVNKTAVCKQETNIIFFGTEAAIEIAK